jgi:phosphohistidine phosphatase
MKQLLLVRHAKSSWDMTTISDFERTLNPRGHKDAPVMASRLKARSVYVDAFVSSPAVRALTTATYFAEAYNRDIKSIIQIPELYHADSFAFSNVVRNIEDGFNTVALFSHNPGITDFINQLTTTKIHDMPTCGIFAVIADIDKWKDFFTAEKKFWFFDHPKA